MSDYIKRGDAVKALADMLAFEAEMDYCGTFTSDDFIDDAKGYFEDIPSADAVPVVRCKDCKHCEYAWNKIPTEQAWVCYKLGIDVEQDWFCADGERKYDE